MEGGVHGEYGANAPDHVVLAYPPDIGGVIIHGKKEKYLVKDFTT